MATLDRRTCHAVALRIRDAIALVRVTFTGCTNDAAVGGRAPPAPAARVVAIDFPLVAEDRAGFRHSKTPFHNVCRYVFVSSL